MIQKLNAYKVLIPLWRACPESYREGRGKKYYISLPLLYA